MDSLEKSRRVENTFKNKFYRKKSWHIPILDSEKFLSKNVIEK